MADARRSYRDLREFISFLEDRGQLKRVTAPVTWDLEITEITEHAREALRQKFIDQG